MQYLINGNKVFETAPPFSEVGEIKEVGEVTILTLAEKEVKIRKPRMPKQLETESTPEIHTQN